MPEIAFIGSKDSRNDTKNQGSATVFELDFDRLETLVQNYFKVHQGFLRDLQDFIGWLRNFEANLTQAE